MQSKLTEGAFFFKYIKHSEQFMFWRNKFGDVIKEDRSTGECFLKTKAGNSVRARSFDKLLGKLNPKFA